MAEAARRLTEAVDGFLASHRVLICDRDGKWTDEFRAILERAGVRIVVTPVQAPSANAYALPREAESSGPEQQFDCADFSRERWRGIRCRDRLGGLLRYYYRAA